MAKLEQTIAGHLVFPGDGGSITADHLLSHVIDRNTPGIQVLLNLVPIGLFAQVLQQMAQPVVTKIQWLDDLRGQVAEGVVHTLEVGFHGHFAVVTFREDIGQPDHRRPPPTESSLRPMAWDMPVQDLRQAHLDHLPDEQGHIVDPLGDDHQVTGPKALLRLLRHLHSHGTLLPQARTTWGRAYQLHAMASKDSRPKTQPPSEIQLLDFLYGEWGVLWRIGGFMSPFSRKKVYGGEILTGRDLNHSVSYDE